MEFREKLIEMLSNIIHDKTNLLNIAKDNMEKSNKIKALEEQLNEENIINVDNENLKETLKIVTDEETIGSIISNIDMIKIVINGKNDGLDLELDESQIALINGIYELINNYRTKLDNENIETKQKLEEFITSCEQLSDEISSGVIKNIQTLEQILKENNISLEEIIKIKFDILRNNNDNYNLNLNGKVKEEIELRLIFKNINIDIDEFSNIEKTLLVNYGNIEEIKNIIKYLEETKITLNKNDLLYILLFSKEYILRDIYNTCITYDLTFNEMFKIPSIFISKEQKETKENILKEMNTEEEYYIISYLENIETDYENFNKNISLLVNNGYNIKECVEQNILMLIIPDMDKNITILTEMNLTNKDFSITVINPYLATSISSFKECGLSEYLSNNPIRLTTSYYRLKQIAANIVTARKNGDIIFRSLSDKKNYWLSKNITKDSEVK